jgi:hypothetical protein
MTSPSNYPQFEALKVSLKQDREGFVLTLRIHPDEIDESILRDFVGARYQVVMVRIGDDEMPHTDWTKWAGILCKNKAFQDHLEVNTEPEAAQKVCELCGIQSRAELKKNKEAQQIFKQLVDDYEKSSPF